MQLKVNREMEAAVLKHGKVEVPVSFEDNLAEKIANAKKNVIAAM